jgi:nucleotide-binding universal stress UspA family protein
MFKRVVVGCDGSPEGSDAAALGASIASATGAGLFLVGVFSPSMFPVDGISDRRTLRALTEKMLRSERRTHAPTATLHAVADISPARALRHFAERWQADVVVIGSRPQVESGHSAIGRHGRQLLGDTPFALAIAARGLHESDGGRPLGSIGVGYDGGRESERALSVAAELSRKASAQLSIVSVVEDRVPVLAPSEWLTRTDLSTLHEAERESALARAESAAAALDIPCQATALVGDPGLRLRAISASVDLVVVGSRRWGPLARLVAGTVGETLASDSSSSVLIVPRPGAKPRRRTKAPTGTRQGSHDRAERRLAASTTGRHR